MTLEAKVMLCALDYCPDGTIYASGDAGLPDLPITNLIVEEMYEPAQFSTNDPASTWVTVDLGRMRVINMISLLKSNLSYVAEWRIRIYDDDPATSSPIYDSGTQAAFPPVTGDGGLPWGEFSWGGSPEAYADLTPGGYNRHSFWPISRVFGRYVRVDISDPSNPTTPTISRLWVSKGYQPTFNILYGSGLITNDDTEVSQMRSGVRAYGRVTKRRGLSMIFDLVPEKEMIFQIYGPIQMGAGKSKEILALLNPTDPETWFFESCLGNQVDVEENDFNFNGHMGTQIKLDESI